MRLLNALLSLVGLGSAPQAPSVEPVLIQRRRTAELLDRLWACARAGGTPPRLRKGRPRYGFRGLKVSKFDVVEYRDARREGRNERRAERRHALAIAAGE